MPGFIHFDLWDLEGGPLPSKKILGCQEIKAQIAQDFALAGNSILNSLSREYATIRQNGTSRKYSSVFSVQGKQGAIIDKPRRQIIAVVTITQNTYAIVSLNRGEELSDMFFSFIWMNIISLYYPDNFTPRLYSVLLNR